MVHLHSPHTDEVTVNSVNTAQRQSGTVSNPNAAMGVIQAYIILGQLVQPTKPPAISVGKEDTLQRYANRRNNQLINQSRLFT